MNETIILQYFIEELDANCSLLDLLQDGFDGPYCNSTTDQIGTCWPKTIAGELVERPCPEFVNGVKYNTTIYTPAPNLTPVLISPGTNNIPLVSIVDLNSPSYPYTYAARVEEIPPVRTRRHTKE
ncbi:Corticotropin-releasing factor receptor 2 [Varanus komodoensis]|nr:Corticotropin-releasing factor receptor 2 [Varanus komodoensis]